MKRGSDQNFGELSAKLSTAMETHCGAGNAKPLLEHLPYLEICVRVTISQEGLAGKSQECVCYHLLCRFKDEVIFFLQKLNRKLANKLSHKTTTPYLY